MLGERDVCGGRDDSDNCLAPSHDPVVMGGLSRRGDTSDKPGSSLKGNVDAGYHIWWEANERFLSNCLSLRSLSCSHGTQLVPIHTSKCTNYTAFLLRLFTC